jgi:hypothetical protein
VTSNGEENLAGSTGKVPAGEGYLLRPAESHDWAAKLDPYRGDRWSLLREALTDTTTFLEFGSGLSTLYVSSNFKCRIRSIETDATWVEAVSHHTKGRAEILYVDLGPVGKWGRPLSYRERGRFPSYWKLAFKDGYNPDLVLIDGRFRVATFLGCLKLTNPGTKIVFDDYPVRDNYRVIEEIVSPMKETRNQALFIRPDSLNLPEVHDLQHQFTMVMD